MFALKTGIMTGSMTGDNELLSSKVTLHQDNIKMAIKQSLFVIQWGQVGY